MILCFLTCYFLKAAAILAAAEATEGRVRAELEVEEIGEDGGGKIVKRHICNVPECGKTFSTR